MPPKDRSISRRTGAAVSILESSSSFSAKQSLKSNKLVPGQMQLVQPGVHKRGCAPT